VNLALPAGSAHAPGPSLARARSAALSLENAQRFQRKDDQYNAGAHLLTGRGLPNALTPADQSPAVNQRLAAELFRSSAAKVQPTHVSQSRFGRSVWLVGVGARCLE
jgi:hypothetical protein